ncbi:HlyD family efflux transporter periplasmic adaptor subunit [Deinococcus sp.]|uniref:efflux RND transporter periplasmic adaptor subunit n=1 Tax=Deinococcus sp. TaxID=47478 RepID=UPI0025D6D97E|nr:HlyD family efflux transporter periplasmic adaptor subunit [Deinococcus sp.]
MTVWPPPSRHGLRPGAALLLGTALLLSACTKPAATTQTDTKTPSGASSTNNLDAAPPKASALNVSVVRPKQGNLSVARSSSATVKAALDSNVAALTGGAVTKVLAQAGQSVQAGQVVVQLDDSTLRQALDTARIGLQNAQINLSQTTRNTSQGDPQLQSAITAAQVSRDKAAQEVQANQKLFTLGGLSAADLKTSQAALAQADSALSLARNNLTQNGQSGQSSLALLQNQVASAQVSFKQAQENLAKASVRAPFSGTVASVGAKLGEYVNTGTAVFRLVNPGSLSAEFSVAPSDAAVLGTGTKLNFSAGGNTYLAQIKAGDRVAGTDRLVLLSARLYGASGLPVGSVGSVRYNVKLAGGALLPTGAIQNDGGSNAVYVVGGGAAVRTPVRILAESQGQVALSGVPSGAQVIYPVPPSLQDGAGVSVGTAKVGSP